MRQYEGRDRGRSAAKPDLSKPRWGPEGELPVLVRVFDEGELRWYGTGTAVADLSNLPISLRLHYLMVRGRPLWVVGTDRVREATMALRKIDRAATAAAAGGGGPQDATMWPTLLEYLTETKYPDGSPREPSCMVITADGSGWRGCVSDKDNGRTLWKTATTVQDLLLALEMALMADEPSDWRQSAAKKWAGKKKG